MSNASQEAFIANLKNALQHRSGAARAFREDSARRRSSHHKNDAGRAPARRTDAERRQLLDRLIEKAAPINLQVRPVAEVGAAAAAIAQLVADTTPEWGDQKSLVAWAHPLIERLKLHDALARQDVALDYIAIKDPQKASPAERQSIRRQISDAYIGVTSADYCVAETGTLVIKNRLNQPRSVSLVPSIHVAVIELKQLVLDLKELYARLQYDMDETGEGLTNCLTFISGPSKTGDIELVMVHGAHGPRALYLFVITD